MTTDLRPSPIESARFGLAIFRAEVADPARVAPLVSACKQAGCDMLVVRCPAASIPTMQALLAAGCILMDTLVYYAAPSPRVPEAPLPPGLRIRPFEPADLAPLEQTARQAFTGYAGHYHADPRLDPAASTEGYVEWFRNQTRAPEVLVLVAELDGEPAGFLTLRRAPPGGSAEIVLNAVSPRCQGRGIYDALVKAAGAACRQRGDARLMVSTQLQNLAPQKVWVRNGLEPLEAHYTFHLWFR